MKKLIVYHGDSPVQVEGFPKECARSCEGALHIHPGKHKTVTDAEYKHLCEKYAWMCPKLKVVAEIGEKDLEAEKKRAEKVKANAEAKDAPYGMDVVSMLKAEKSDEAVSSKATAPMESSSSSDGGKKSKKKR